MSNAPTANPIAPNPIAVEVTRGRDPADAYVESRHRAACAVVAADGTLVHGWGDVGTPVFPRSAIKPIQALPLLESGAAEAFNMSAAEISLSCASHNSEDRHVETVTAALARAGLTPDDLECGPQVSSNKEVLAERLYAGVQGSPLRNNCSGKHMGFLLTARHLGEETRGYVRRDHPVQQRLFQVISEMCGVDVTGLPEGIDGCSIPCLALPLSNLALGMARLADPRGLGEVREAAAKKIIRSIAAEPFMIAGTGRFCTAANAAFKSRAIVKTGAEGVMMSAVPELGLGVALKIDDGDRDSRANGVAMAAVLRFLGVLDDGAAAEMAGQLEIPVRDLNGARVGSARAHAQWPSG